MGNVGGRFYLNVSFVAAFFAGFSLSRERLNYELGGCNQELYGVAIIFVLGQPEEGLHGKDSFL
jgi:hypothetical protein